MKFEIFVSPEIIHSFAFRCPDAVFALDRKLGSQEQISWDMKISAFEMNSGVTYGYVIHQCTCLPTQLHMSHTLNTFAYARYGLCLWFYRFKVKSALRHTDAKITPNSWWNASKQAGNMSKERSENKWDLPITWVSFPSIHMRPPSGKERHISKNVWKKLVELEPTQRATNNPYAE